MNRGLIAPGFFLLFCLGLFGGMTPYTPLRVLSVVLAYGAAAIIIGVITILIYVIGKGARRP